MFQEYFLFLFAETIVKKSWEYIPKFSSIDLRPTYLGFKFFIFAFDVLKLFSNL